MKRRVTAIVLAVLVPLGISTKLYNILRGEK